MVTRRLPFPGTLLTIQCAPDWSASQSPLGVLLKSSSLSLPDVFLSTRRLLATRLPPNQLAPSWLLDTPLTTRAPLIMGVLPLLCSCFADEGTRQPTMTRWRLGRYICVLLLTYRQLLQRKKGDDVAFSLTFV